MNIAIIIVVLVAAAGGLLSAIVADAKKRSPLGWALAGAMFPVLGLIAIAGMPMAQPMPQQEPSGQSEELHRNSVDEGTTETGRMISVAFFGALIIILALVNLFYL